MGSCATAPCMRDRRRTQRKIEEARPQPSPPMEINLGTLERYETQSSPNTQIPERFTQNRVMNLRYSERGSNHQRDEEEGRSSFPQLHLPRQQEEQNGPVHERLEGIEGLIQLFQIIRNRDGPRDPEDLYLFIRLIQLLGQEEEPQRLSPQQVEKLRRVVAKQDGSCAICQDKVAIGEMLMSLSCSHSFHEQCLRPWLQRSRQCPLCRVEIKP